MKIVICGGHLTPALALIDELKKQKGIEIIFFGRKYATEGVKNISVEYKLIKEQNIKFYEITAGRIQRKFTKYTIGAIFKIPIGFVQSFVYLILTRPKLVISFGGYLSTPVIFSAWLLGMDSIAHEQPVIAGLSSRINSLFVNKTYLSWPQTVRYFEKNKSEVIGNLTRKVQSNSSKINKTLLNFVNKPGKLIFITGGNQGSHFLNQLVFKLLAHLKNYKVLHQVGTTNWRNDLDIAKQIKSENYLSVDYLEFTDFSQSVKKSSIVISRSGANTVWDLIMFNKPAILIPLAISANSEQLLNANILKDANCARVVKEQDADVKKIISEIKIIFENLPQYKTASVKLAKSLPNDACAKLTKVILSYT